MAWAPVPAGQCPSIVVLLRDSEPDKVRSVVVNGKAATFQVLPARVGLPNRISIDCPEWGQDGAGLRGEVELGQS